MSRSRPYCRVMAYPPEPWHLKGQLLMSIWAVPAGVALAAGDPPPGTRPITVAGRCLTACVWLRYEHGGVLEYDEVLSAVLVRLGRRIMVWIPHIWVDSPVSMAGGRELWGLPKQLAVFDPHSGDRYGAAQSSDGVGIASARLGRLVGLPGRWPVSYDVVQTMDGAAKVSPVRFKGRLQLLRGRWTFTPDGPLAHFSRRRTLLNIGLRDFDLQFGGPVKSLRRDEREYT